MATKRSLASLTNTLPSPHPCHYTHTQKVSTVFPSAGSSFLPPVCFKKKKLVHHSLNPLPPPSSFTDSLNHSSSPFPLPESSPAADLKRTHSPVSKLSALQPLFPRQSSIQSLRRRVPTRESMISLDDEKTNPVMSSKLTAPWQVSGEATKSSVTGVRERGIETGASSCRLDAPCFLRPGRPCRCRILGPWPCTVARTIRVNANRKSRLETIVREVLVMSGKGERV